MAVDGVQPSIPQNPLSIVQLSSSANEQMIHRIEDDDIATNMSLVASSSTIQQQNQLDTAAAQDVLSSSTSSNSNVTIRQLLPRLLSEELQFYFTRITLAIEQSQTTGSNSSSIIQQDAALSSMKNDAGIQELIPFFSRFITTQILLNINNYKYCRLLIRFIDSLFDNIYIHLELHLHQMIPSIITCIVGKKASSNSSTTNDTDYDDDHWILREEASRALLKACKMFGQQYTTLKSRILKTFVQAIDIRTKPCSTIYGGIVGITTFGPKAIDAFLLPIASFYYKVWDQMLLDEDNDKDEETNNKNEIQYCQYAIVLAIGIYLQEQHKNNNANNNNNMSFDYLNEFKDIVGEKLIPFYHGHGPVECDIVLL